MTLYLRAARAAVRRLPDLDEERRADVAATVEDLAQEQTSRRWSELGSLLWLGASLRSRADTGGSPGVNWLQGVHRGGALLLAATAVDSVAVAGWIGDVAALPAVLTAAAWAAVTDRRRSALVLIVAAAVLVLLDGGPIGAAFWTRLAVAGAALAIGEAPGREQGRMCPWRWTAAIGAGCCLVHLVPAAHSVAVDVVATALVPAAWLVLARADPRLAVGAATVLTWRLVAVDMHELGAALVALPSDLQVDVLLLRWLVMGIGATAAFWVASASIRRASRL